MKIALTGATGFIGKYIALEYLKPGDGVRALARPSSRVDFLTAKGAEIVRGDFDDDAALRDLLTGVDALVHCGYWHDEDETVAPMKWFELNVLSSLKMLEWCRERGIRRYVFISTGAVYGHLLDPTKPRDEYTGAFPRGGYAAYNRAVEVYVDAYRNEFDMAGSTSIRLCGRNIGVNRRLDMCPYLDILRAAVSGREIHVRGYDQFDCCADVAHNLRVVLSLPMEKVQNVYCFADDPQPMRAIAEAIVHGVGSASRVVEEASEDPFVGTSNARIKAAGGRFSGLAGIESYAREMVPVLKSS